MCGCDIGEEALVRSVKVQLHRVKAQLQWVACFEPPYSIGEEECIDKEHQNLPKL